jgi:hypothetical protein
MNTPPAPRPDPFKKGPSFQRYVWGGKAMTYADHVRKAAARGNKWAAEYVQDNLTPKDEI